MATQQDKDFWLNKWVNNEIGFHLNKVNPLLKKYAATFFEAKAPVLVPLCGKTHDMVYLAAQGHSVTGIELSEMATSQFFDEVFALGKKSSSDLIVTTEKQFKSFQQENIKLLAGDIFELSNDLIQNVKTIYDRAALIALPPVIRQQYVKHLRQQIPHAKLLLITLDYQQDKFSGPPFSVPEKEVMDLFSFAKVRQMEREDIIEKQQKFKSAGLAHFYQSVYQIEW